MACMRRKRGSVAKESSKIFYGWIIVAVSFITMSLAGTARYSFSVFYVPILEEFGWSRGATAAAFAIHMLIYAAAAPLVGLLLDRFGPRRTMPLAALIIALVLAGSSRMTLLWQFYLALGLLGFGLCFLWFVPYTTIVANWFLRQRGAAMGLISAGVGGTYLLVFLIGILVASLGWRYTYLIMGAALAVVIVPLTAFFLRLRPQEMGLEPDGYPTQAAERIPQTSTPPSGSILDREWTLREAVRTLRFWLLFIMSLFSAFQFNLVTVHLVAHVVDLGYSEILGASLVSLVGLSSLLGNLGGFLSDRIGREAGITLGTLASILAMALLLLPAGSSAVALLYLAAIAFGLGIGIISPTQSALVADLFQGKNFGSINGATMLGFGLGGALGPWLGGYLFDRAGSYAFPFTLALLLTLASCVLAWLAAPRRVRRPWVRP